jgi:competence protein ComEA
MMMVGLRAAVPAEPGQASKTSAAQATAASPINLNVATAADLEKLPGVGPAMANRILEYRQKSGGFKKIEDLMNVTGIGEKNFLKLKAQLTVGPAKADHAPQDQK